MKSSVTIIGGADGPTSIFVTGNVLPYIIGGVVVAILAVVGIILWHKRKK